jgi:hypothetical protein
MAQLRVLTGNGLRQTMQLLYGTAQSARFLWDMNCVSLTLENNYLQRGTVESADTKGYSSYVLREIGNTRFSIEFYCMLDCFIQCF